MRHSRISVILLTTIILLAASAVPVARAQDAPPRTYYDTLNLDTPEDAAQTFVDAFQRLDFPTAFLVLAPNAQFRFQQLINLVRYEQLFDYPTVALLHDNYPRMDTWEHFEVSYFFDILMLIALDSDGFLIDLRGDVQWTGERDEVTIGEDTSAVDLPATVEGINGPVKFRMVLSPEGRWRVLQVIVPGGDETQIPWSVPPPIQRHATALWKTPCDGTAPEQPVVVEGQPLLILAPLCGDMAGTASGEGSEITLQGFNFQPGVEVALSLYNPDLEQSRPFNVEEPVVAGDDGTFTVTLTLPRWRGLELPVTLEIRAAQVFRLRDE